jgi:vanillate O-demethylase monooxygenase subunit
MLLQQQRNLDHYPDRKLLLLNIDAGGVRSRRMIEQAIAGETSAA